MAAINNIEDKLKMASKRKIELFTDLCLALDLMIKQYAQMDRNSPLCPTWRAIQKTAVLCHCSEDRAQELLKFYTKKD
jgi:hypothetical protein